MAPILSILVATRNRIPYCINLIETILSFEYENFELVIQDNSDTLELSDYAQTILNDKRFLYNYSPNEISSIDNFNKVIDLANGEYICIIGDDDGVTSDIFELVEWAKSKNHLAIYPKFNVMYRWPDACGLLSGYETYDGNLEIFNVSGTVQKHNVDKNFKKLLQFAGQNFLNIKLPKLYHGIIKRSCMLQIHKKLGFFVGGLSPDIYFGASLSKEIQELVYIDYPIFVSGVCKVPILERMNVKIDLPDQAPHYRNRHDYIWSEKIPYFYCSENMWAESLAAALKDLNLITDVERFNYSYLYYILLNKYPERKSEIYNVFKSNSKKSIFVQDFANVYFETSNTLSKIVNKIRRLLFNNVQRKLPYLNSFTFDHVIDIKDAVKETELYLVKNKIKLKDILK